RSTSKTPSAPPCPVSRSPSTSSRSRKRPPGKIARWCPSNKPPQKLRKAPASATSQPPVKSLKKLLLLIVRHVMVQDFPRLCQTDSVFLVDSQRMIGALDINQRSHPFASEMGYRFQIPGIDCIIRDLGAQPAEE